MLYKDACNAKSNQQNLGTIKSSNLCTEIVEYTCKDEVAVCNLASISLSKFADYETRQFDYDYLHKVTKRVTKNLNKVIDRNYYPIKEAENSNMRHRPIGIGVQGLADAYQKMGIPFESKDALDINNKIFETIYHAAMETSMEIAQKEGHYETFKGSPLSKGQFQFDLWGKKPWTNRYDWDKLRADVMKHGARNSLLVAPMPTASTSQILGNNESFEPFTSNIYTRRVLSGEFICVNKHLVRDLIRLNLWTSEIKNAIVANNGSVQDISKIPEDIRNLYKTIWEIKQKDLMDLAIGRGPYICQSQSLNLYQANPVTNKMSNMHFYAWRNGLKTGQYYFRSRPARDAIKFTVNVDMLLQAADKGSTNQVLEVLNSDNAEANALKKRKRTTEVQKIDAKRLPAQQPTVQTSEAKAQENKAPVQQPAAAE
jgi:ribonucleoside-diphosphate reductase alpha subunit